MLLHLCQGMPDLCMQGNSSYKQTRVVVLPQNQESYSQYVYNMLFTLLIY